jgi:hypothetical protein
MVRAKKGDYRAFNVTHSFTSVHGPSKGHSTLKLERVTKTNRTGEATESVPIFRSYAPTRGIVSGQLILRRERINALAMEKALESRGDDEFYGLTELKDFLSPFKRT